MDVWNREAEAVTQHRDTSSDPFVFMFTIEKNWLSFCCLCSNTKLSLRKKEGQRCKGTSFMVGELQPLKLLPAVKVNPSLPHCVLLHSRFFTAKY